MGREGEGGDKRDEDIRANINYSIIIIILNFDGWAAETKMETKITKLIVKREGGGKERGEREGETDERRRGEKICRDRE